MIDSAQHSDAGTYTCLAENPAGVTRAVTPVIVKIPPRILIAPDNTAVSLTEQVTLKCTRGCGRSRLAMVFIFFTLRKILLPNKSILATDHEHQNI